MRHKMRLTTLRGKHKESFQDSLIIVKNSDFNTSSFVISYIYNESGLLHMLILIKNSSRKQIKIQKKLIS